MSLLTRSGNDFRLSVHATPGARHEKVGGEHDGALRVSVTAVADKGRANEAIVECIAKALDLKPWQVTLASGATNRRKTFTITDASDDLVERVAKLAAGG